MRIESWKIWKSEKWSKEKIIRKDQKLKIKTKIKGSKWKIKHWWKRSTTNFLLRKQRLSVTGKWGGKGSDNCTTNKKTIGKKIVGIYLSANIVITDWRRAKKFFNNKNCVIIMGCDQHIWSLIAVHRKIKVELMTLYCAISATAWNNNR